MRPKQHGALITVSLDRKRINSSNGQPNRRQIVAEAIAADDAMRAECERDDARLEKLMRRQVNKSDLIFKTREDSLIPEPQPRSMAKSEQQAWNSWLQSHLETFADDVGDVMGRAIKRQGDDLRARLDDLETRVGEIEDRLGELETWRGANEKIAPFIPLRGKRSA
jgi:hypothetical protein